MSKRRIGSLIFTTLLLSTMIVAALNVQFLQDKIRYHQYQPNEMVASFVTDTGMNDHGEFLFYASHPALSDADAFNQQCEKRERTAAILGCYDGRNIYIYNITDERLDGIRPTTAAHEMLHVAYERLDEDDRLSVDSLLEAEYNKLKNNAELSERMAFYERTQPGDRDNELHSIIGTEVANIGTELEEYYRRYFSDRSKVVAQHQQYYGVFESLRARADTLNRQIEALGAEINAKKTNYSRDAEALSAAIQDFNTRANRGDFASRSQFDAERQALLARSAAVEASRIEINNSVNRYNELVTELNKIATETEDLNHSMDSNLEPVPGLQ